MSGGLEGTGIEMKSLAQMYALDSRMDPNNDFNV